MSEKERELETSKKNEIGERECESELEKEE